jgi:transposase-like protein
MELKRTDEFRQDAVRIALTSGLTRKQVADDPLPDRVLRSNVPRRWMSRCRR